MKGKETREAGLRLVREKLEGLGLSSTKDSLSTLVVKSRSTEKTVKVHARCVRKQKAGDGTDTRMTKAKSLDWANRWDFHVFVRHDGNKIHEWFVCSQGDYEDLIECHSKGCGFYPYRTGDKRKDGTDRSDILAKWQERKNEKGWKLIADAFTPEANGQSGKRAAEKAEESCLRKYGKGGESPYHKAMKKCARENRHLFGVPKGAKSHTEYPLPSGDVLDVLFKSKIRWTAVEVKSHISNDEDIRRGVYQCVKYHAVLGAMHKAGKAPAKAKVFLFLESIPPKLKTLAKKLGVRIIIK